MTDKKTTLKVLLYEHNSEANALLRSDYYSLGPALERYLNFVDSNPLTRAFVDDCVQNHLPEGFYISRWQVHHVLIFCSSL